MTWKAATRKAHHICWASLQRDRRWCHGNLQHLWFLFERRLKTVSRFNILNGIMAYASAPLWLLSLILGALLTMDHNEGVIGGSSGMFNPGAIPGVLYAYILCLLLLPKVLGATILMRSPEKLKLCGGIIRVALGVVAETLHSILMAPILMLFYTRFVLATFSGRAVRWGRQIRSGAEGPGWSVWIVTHGSNFLFTLAAMATVLWLSPSMVLWLMPILVGPLLAVPLSRITASAKLGRKAKSKKWFLIPEESAPPDELAALAEPVAAPQNALLNSRDYARDYGLLKPCWIPTSMQSMFPCCVSGRKPVFAPVNI